MTDQDVENDRIPLSTTVNGKPSTLDDASAARLRSEFAQRISVARSRFGSALVEIQDAADAMQKDGRPPSYQLLHVLGECNREFLRLRTDLTRRAQALSLPLPTIETLNEISDLVRLFDTSPGSDSPDPVEPVAASRPEVPTPPVVHPVEDADATPMVLEPAEPVQSTSEPEPAVLEITAAEPVAEPDSQVEDPGEAVRRSALEVIDSVLRLESRDSEFPPLRDCQAQALALRETVAGSPSSDLPAEAADLAEGRHPFAGTVPNRKSGT